MNNFADILASEWVKIRSVRSTYWNLIILFVLTVGLGALIASVMSVQGGEGAPSGSAAELSLVGTYFGVVAVVALGALVITAEYSTGMIRTSLTAVPRRIPFLSGKAVVLFALVFVIGAVACFFAYLISRPIFANKGLPSSLGDPGVLRIILGGGLYLGVTALFTFALGAILRQTAGVITIMLGLLFVAPVIAQLLPASLPIGKYLPDRLGQGIMALTTPEGALSPWAGFFLYCGYTVVLLAIAFYLTEKRDA